MKTGDLVIASNLLTCGNTNLKVWKIIKNIINAGIITTKHGQFTQAIAITIPHIIKPVFIHAYENLRIFPSTESVSFDNLFNILPYGVVSKKESFVRNKLNNILLCNFYAIVSENVVNVALPVNPKITPAAVNPIYKPRYFIEVF